jgi:hypothetical protein
MQAATKIKASQNHFLPLFINSLLLIAQGTDRGWTRIFDPEPIHSYRLSSAAGQETVSKGIRLTKSYTTEWCTICKKILHVVAALDKLIARLKNKNLERRSMKKGGFFDGVCSSCRLIISCAEKRNYQLAGNRQKQNGSDTITFSNKYSLCKDELTLTDSHGKEAKTAEVKENRRSDRLTLRGEECDFLHPISDFPQNVAVRFMPP